MRILLIQIRGTAAAANHERECFLAAGGLDPGSLTTLDLVGTPEPDWHYVDEHDVLLIGGAGAHSAAVDHPFTASLGDIVLRWADEGRPVFGSCWGHHFLARLYGGTVDTDPASAEIGTFTIECTDEGLADPLLRGVPKRFDAQLGHHDRVVNLPSDFVALAHSAACQNQILRRRGGLVYGTQFHSEMDAQALRDRLELYREAYLGGGDGEAVEVRPSPMPQRILRRFLELARTVVEEREASSASFPAITRRLPLGGAEADSRVTWNASALAGPGGSPDQPEADLIVLWHPDEDQLGRRYRLAPGSTIEIGRSIACEISLRNVLSVSRRHARVRYLDGVVELEDLGSTNHTYLHDRPLDGPAPLASGDRFQVGAVHFKFLRERDPEHAYHQAIYQLVSHDGLTEVFNKRKFAEDGEREFLRARRYDRPLTLLLLDVDHFKVVNDQHGHLCGDYVLKRLAKVVQAELRPEQILARVGGEEFAILCPETDLAGGSALAERLRAAIQAATFHFAGRTIPVTCSFGVAQSGPAAATLEDLYARADQALYAAKHAGRNRVACGAPGEDGGSRDR